MSNLERKTAGGPPSSGFRLDKRNAKLWGVCSGIANYFNVDSTLVRIGFVAGTLIGFGSLLLVYAAIALIAD
ncbi:PspC domain-containing protein [Pontixanthobacter aquaemixtae]|uniref:PspC domain-containing protein n=1 Tax=Pontixanthobacter aquaemixtae TaxID=1958940 RepID=A0A844ZZC8_9SPHN|nr:PspC domain-containing protein [Pontixanthobacter aquaemixtae]MXO90789.1 PspC domain-containing protein [Pontixanthobacter aquaemixtae]